MAGFLVVKIVKENSVTVVSSSWIKEEEDGSKVCAWPPYKSLTRLVNAVKNHEPPESSWQWIKVVILNNVDTYEEGLVYEEQAMYTSNFTTNCKELESKKKSNNKRKRSVAETSQCSSEDEKSSSELHEPPNSSWQWIEVAVVKSDDTYQKGLEYEEQAIVISDVTTKCEEVKSKMKNNNKENKAVEQSQCSEDEESSSELPPLHQPANSSWQFMKVAVKENADIDGKGLECEKPTKRKSIFRTVGEQVEREKKMYNKRKCTVAESNLECSSEDSDSSSLPPFHLVKRTVTRNHNIHRGISRPSQPLMCHTSQSNYSNVSKQLCTQYHTIQRMENNEEERFQKKMLQMLETIQQDIKELKESLRIPKYPLPQLPPACPKLPCDNTEDLKDLNNILQDNAIFNSICDYLSIIGGNSVTDCTRRVLQKLISQNLSLKYNWKGTKGDKLGFSIFTSITKLILGVVRKNPSSSSATAEDVNYIIKRWLMYAKDRDGGRNFRLPKQENF